MFISPVIDGVEMSRIARDVVQVVGTRISIIQLGGSKDLVLMGALTTTMLVFMRSS